jgi:hypothetical protein
MRLPGILRAFAVVILLIIAIVDIIPGFDFKIGAAIVAAGLFYLSFYASAEDNKKNHDTESILVVVFLITLVGLILLFSSIPTHIIVEPDSINETFAFPNDIGDSNKTISIINLGTNAVKINIRAEGNNIRDNNEILLFADQLRNSIANISNNASALGKSELDTNSNNSINANITHIMENIDSLSKDPSNPSSTFKNMRRAIENITTTINSVENGSKPLREETKTLIDNLKSELISMKSDIANNSAIFILLDTPPQIEPERTGYVSMEIDPNMALRNGEYKGAIIIETDDKKLRKEVPISINIKGIASGSTEPKAKENKSVTFKSMTLNLTGSLSS